MAEQQQHPIDNNTNNHTNNRRSQKIPLPDTHVHRTRSELQLCEDMETADQRDLNMYYRLVNGIRERRSNRCVAQAVVSPATAPFWSVTVPLFLCLGEEPRLFARECGWPLVELVDLFFGSGLPKKDRNFVVADFGSFLANQIRKKG